jgi:alkylation response protein AidB-like acyl-CoA dehydrogenase
MAADSAAGAGDLMAAVERLAPMLIAASDEIEATRRLSPSVVAAMAEAGLFRMFVPRSLGGSELDPLSAAHVIEALAAVESASAWCAMIATQFSWPAGILAAEAATEIFGSPESIVAGQAFPAGQAIEADGGFQLTARWPFISGCQHATWLHGAAIVRDGEAPRLTPAGTPEMRFFYFPREAATIIDTWDVIGLRGTGSHDISVTDITVPMTRTCVFPPTAHGIASGPLYHPIGVLLIFVTQAGHAFGMARHAIAALVALAHSKTRVGARSAMYDQQEVQIQVAEAEAMLGAARAYVAEATNAIWDSLTRGEEPSTEQHAHLRLAITFGIRTAVRVVDLMYSTAGSSAIYTRNPLDRVFRDSRAAAAHVQGSVRPYEEIGRHILSPGESQTQ